MCFAAQMFGAGKTMLGRNLVTQLKKADSELQAHLKDFLDAERSRGEDGRKFAEFFSQEVEKFRQAEQLYVDLRGLSDVAAVPGATAKVAGVQMPQSITDVADAIAQVLIEAAREKAPLFVAL